jgi:probable phosphoglycerate mutase
MPADRDASFLFVRHGATQYNLLGLRCGGDLDAELTDVGRVQSHHAAEHIRAMDLTLRRIITSSLVRARQTASIVSEALGGIPVTVEPLLNERLLGEWNMRPVAETEALLASQVTPPGGESEEAFTRRICATLDKLTPQLTNETLLVSSSGVGRVMHALLGGEGRLRLPNGGIARFTLVPDAFALKLPEMLP